MAVMALAPLPFAARLSRPGAVCVNCLPHEPFQRRSRALRAPDRAQGRGRSGTKQTQGRARAGRGAGGLGSPALQYLAGAGVGGSALSTTTSSRSPTCTARSSMEPATSGAQRRRAPRRRSRASIRMSRSSRSPRGWTLRTPAELSRASMSFSTAPTISRPAMRCPTPAFTSADRWSRPRSANSTAR